MQRRGRLGLGWVGRPLLRSFRWALLVGCAAAGLGFASAAAAQGRDAGEACGPLAPCADPLVCAFPEFRCRHDPPIEDEPCSVFVPCAEDLACTGVPGTCKIPRSVGEGCSLIFPCMDELDCALCIQGECDHPFECFPQGTNTVSRAQCLDWYRPGIHESAMDLETTRTIGGGTAGAVGVGASTEIGVVYGQDGRYGCYHTSCLGGESNASIEDFVSLGFYNDYDSVRGDSLAIIEEAGEILNVSTAQIFSPGFGEFLGTASCGSIGVSVLPISVGLYSCNTIVDTVIGNSPPNAVCADQTVCAGELSCMAVVDVDDGSSDPDGDDLTLSQSPSSPYGIGSRTVTLTATDTSGDTDSCTADVMVNDCHAPSITCPADSTAECQSTEQAVVDPGDAAVTDCSSFGVTDPGPASYPVGTTDVLYTATDVAGNAASCTARVSVVDTLAPDITSVVASLSTLWPPNHEMRTVQIAIEATDVCDPTLTCAVVAVASDEPAGKKAPDAEILGPGSVSLRAERDGSGAGRTYTITVECADDTGGNTTAATTTVVVPHSQGDRG